MKFDITLFYFATVFYIVSSIQIIIYFFRFNEKNLKNSRILFEIDTTNFIVTSTVQPKDTLDLEMGIGTCPTFRNIKMIKIYGTDSTYLKNKEKMNKAFTEKRKYQYQLIIK